MSKDVLQQCRQWISEGQRMVFFGGAGVSTESGIPDFRSVDGLYNQQWDAPPETILSHTYFVRNHEGFYKFYKTKMLYLDAQPNDAHKALARLEAQGRLAAVVTQNIDGLHQKAGSNCVYELHGSVLRNHCVKCHTFYDVKHVAEADGVPVCTRCGGVIKPDVVLYEEGLDRDTMLGAVEAISKADVLIVGGTSLGVYPAAGMLDYYNGKRLILINKTPTPRDNLADLIVRDSIGAVLSACVPD